MKNIIIACSNIEVANKIKSLLVGSGLRVYAVCKSASQVLMLTSRLDEGVVISSYRLSDTIAPNLQVDLPSSFSMLMLLSSVQMETVDDGVGVFKLLLPVNKNDLIKTVNVMQALDLPRQHYEASRKRSDKDEAIIRKAKAILIDRNRLTEYEAHKYLQKKSMDSGRKMIDIAQIILDE